MDDMFEDIGHSSDARAILRRFLIGTLVSNNTGERGAVALSGIAAGAGGETGGSAGEHFGGSHVLFGK